jgi:AraC family transcriptional activator of pobA
MDGLCKKLHKSNMTQAEFGDAVATYNLFGELGDLPDVAHVETIPSRAALVGWEFPAHRHARLHQVLWIETGGGVAHLDGREYALGPGVAVNVPLGCVHAYKFKPHTDGYVLTLTTEMCAAALEPSRRLRDVLESAGVFATGADFGGLMQRIAGEYQSRDFARAQMLQALSGLLLGEVARLLVRQGRSSALNAETGRFHEFEQLLELHYADQWSVAQYASSMGITPVHLNRLARTARGRPVSRLIDERVIREARRYLAYTDLPISKIGYALGFSDPAYFTRVFSRVTGFSPRELRTRLAAKT